MEKGSTGTVVDEPTRDIEGVDPTLCHPTLNPDPPRT